MMKKIIGFIICTLLIASAVHPVIGNANQIKYVKSEADQNPEISTNIKPVSSRRDNSNTWVNVNPKTIGGTLYERERFNMVYDSSAQRTIMFGGIGVGKFNDTWAYNYSDNKWYKMNPETVGGTLTARLDYAMCYDSDADRTILFGGQGSGSLYDDTWVYNYNDNTWYNMTPEVVGGTLSPRSLMNMVYDSSAQRTIMFGGICVGGFNDTWAYNYSDNKWYKMNPETVGGTLNATYAYGMVYDPSADKTIMFGGGHAEGDTWTNETWVYNYNDNKWYKMNPETIGGTLLNRLGSVMVYDPDADKTLLFGGQKDGGSAQLNDTWVYNFSDNKWYNISYSVVGGSLYHREFPAMVYDSTHKKTILFAGFTDDLPPEQQFLNDTWMFKYNIENEPPNPPTNPEPTNSSINIEIDANLSWYCWDPDGDDLTYDVYFEADDPTPDDKVSSNQEETTYDPGTLEFDTTYYWQIVAWDTEDHNTAGPIWHFTTRENNPPYTPGAPSPEDGETGVYINTELNWTGGDPDGDEVTYDVYFGTSSPPPKVESNQSGTTYDPGLLDFDTKYYWRIVAWDEYDYSAEGPIWSFTTEENLPPYEPSDPNPPDGATDVTIYKILSWKGGDPNVGDPVTYDVYLGDSSPPPLIAEDLTYEAYDPGTMDLDTTYYWQIISEDSGGLTTEGPIWSFTTEKEPNEPPTAPDIDGPSKGKPGKEICWTFHSEDPNDNDIKYIIDWGDENSEETDYYPSCTPAEACHAYGEEGSYIIKAIAEDTKEARSDESTFEVEIPRTRTTTFLWYEWLLGRFPLLERLLNIIFLKINTI